MTTLFQIRHRHTDAVLFEGEYESLKLCVVAAVERGANLSGANLRGANLSGANLRGANLRGADLSGANLRDAYLRDADLSGANLRDANLRGAYLRGADLSGANLRDANLRGADLSGANLRGADLSGANLRCANLRDANLSGANLRDANLSGANLSGANLTPIRDDVWAVLSSAPAEAAGLLTALREGRVDGSTYVGDCACLVGTIANVRGIPFDTLGLLKPDSDRPAEKFFMLIHTGDTPETCEASRIAAEWVEDWITRMRSAFGGEAGA